MMKFRKFVLVSNMVLYCVLAHAGLDVHLGKVEYLKGPDGLDTPCPRFSWSMTSDARGCIQGAYQILVAGSMEKIRADQGDLWDSGKVASDQSAQVSYGGRALESGTRYYWKARVWDQAGRVSGYGEPQSFSMGLLEPADWKGKWITGGNLFRKPFVVNKPLKRAQVFIAGLGYYELHLNGAKVGDHVLDPLWTEYTKTVRYVTYDISERVFPGANAIGVMLGNGHFTGTRHNRGVRLLLQMRIDFADGTTTNIVSDESWKTASGPIVGNHVFNGETYDARLEREGWDRAEYDDKDWIQATVKDGPGGQLVAQACQPIKVIETLAPKAMSNPGPGVYVCDFGQNFAGWVHLRVRGARGDKVVLRFAEDLGKDGMIDPTTNRSAKNTDTYILKGGGEAEEWEPRFTYHGFRYVEITGFPGVPRLENLQGRVVHNSVDEIGEFACSNELINRIHRAMRWGMRSNLYGVLTDCPQREERAGWLECGHLLADALMFNFELGAFYTKWIRDMADAQNDEGSLPPEVPYCGWAGWPGDPAWASSMVLCPWSMYGQYEDTRILETYYDNMRRWVEFLGNRADNHIVKYNVFGDWANPSVEGTPGELISTAYYYLCINILKESSRLLGKQEAERKYEALAEAVKTAFNKEFLYGFPAQPLKFLGASTSLPPAGKNNVENLLDQDAKTYFWSCRPPKPGDHITVDLGEAKSIKRIMASFRGGDFFDQGLLQSSLDGVLWSEIGRINANFMNQGLKPTPMRYVRLLATKDQTPWICLLDLTVLEAGDGGKPDHYQYVNGSQGCSAFPLALGLVPEAHKCGIVQALADNVVKRHQGHLGIGEVGLKYLLESLTENGRADVVYGMVTKTNAPSWGDMLAKGHTTLVEMWDGSGSHNHIMWGTIEAWFYEALAGINRDPAIPGYKRIIIKPRVVGDLTWAKGSVKTVRGVVASGWEKRGDALTMTVTIPANATAEIHVPKLGMKRIVIKDNGKTLWCNGDWIEGVEGITGAKDYVEHVRLEAGSGTYRFDIQENE